ncbi:MAG TPA: tRNA (N(6)-L-threonylcarbamoyladenosine(37)-C(2))-methylthiotransferase MtaB [Candidatus Krumholzibacteria bacterium]|nr:tRNA (N(6)-L-threonylcarbamoyladenosine(37)-C(2))-methylthiotransferase MtaB [Candidatus Krumholzibacteria bacterium]HPD71568.1 tRNA (N(6)-L-threonylcarbamoyladenosine(37)-C(2))-methylthiotransferase MtaB [Candidatus Krumholzibacteria bacterium]HRY41499.1 tRNA (N(6)-L-threonylcarbamoyladenosine(37)-C(2))-methylthiotransferase MtaB [Candidatus Krumholzibacteria bacterium]
MADQDRQGRLRVAFRTLGCRLNQYDTEGLKLALGGAVPLEVVPWEGPADLYVLNSCTVTGKAAHECCRLAREAKRRQPAARVVVTGCYAQARPQELAARAELAGVVGNLARDDVARWLPAVLARPADGAEPFVLVDPFPREAAFAAPIIESFAGRSRATIKVQDGCDLRCSYCQIWQARGPGRSRTVPEVLAQVDRLHTGSGYNEIVLAGIHLGSWGRDLGSASGGLAGLLGAVCDRFPGIRVRLSSLHPDEVTGPLLTLLGERSQIRPHLHLSVQSGSDPVLRRMRRPYRAASVLAAAAAAVAAAPGCGLGADIIVGFPGETALEFADTVRLVEALPLSYLHVFRFSPRTGTPAASLEPVRPEAVRERAARLRELGRRKQAVFAAARVGEVREAVVERGPADAPSRRIATTDNYAAVAVESDLASGTLVMVECEQYRGGRLRGRVARVLREVPA